MATHVPTDTIGRPLPARDPSDAILLTTAATPIGRILSRFDRDQLAAFVTVAVDLIDAIDGEADLEDDGNAEPTGDENDIAWSEWHTRSIKVFIGGEAARTMHASGQSLTEDDEPGEDQCDAHDDGCGAIVIQGRTVWGSERDHPPLLPSYGIDQTAEPTNVRAANMEHKAREIGLVRSSTGGWRWP